MPEGQVALGPPPEDLDLLPGPGSRRRGGGQARSRVPPAFVSLAQPREAGEYLSAIAWAERNGFKACFSAGTPLYGKDGAKAIELFRSYEEHGDDCDWIVSRSEHDDDAPLVLRRVLRRFERQSLVLELTIGGQKIGTTAEHPFFANGKGWTATQELQPGDEVRLMSPGWAKLESVVDTGRVELVYNLEVEDDHTYFVGCDQWGFSVWAHNSYGEFERIVTNPKLKNKLDTFDAKWAYDRIAGQGEAALRQELKAAGLHPATIEKAVAVAKADG